MLYADLMLLIGHECKQWNKGIHTNDNYMFKRWLRKYSTTFNWQERRFQALCMAFEAAAGSKSCMQLTTWIEERILRMKYTGGDVSEAGARWQVCDGYEVDQNSQTTPNNFEQSGDSESDKLENVEQNENHKSSYASGNDIISALSDLKKKFDIDRSVLLSSNESELLAFDRQTDSLEQEGISDSFVFNQRKEDRKLMILNHKKVLVNLAVKYKMDKASLMQHRKNAEDETFQLKKKDLALSAPVAIVCDIAFQLVKQCIAMKLYQGGILICEAVSLYLKERALRYLDQVQKWQRFEERQEFDGKPVLQLEKEAYDNVSANSTKVISSMR
jgi:hypothetical protein